MKLSSLREQLSSLPDPLQRVLAFRLLSALISAILLVACLVFTPGIRLALPPLICMVYSLFVGSSLFSDWANDNCICLQGTCSAIEKTLFRRRTAAIYVSLEDRLIMLRPIFSVPSVHTGDNVSIYLSRHFPVYERDGVQVIPRYYALSVTPDLSVVDGQKA